MMTAVVKKEQGARDKSQPNRTVLDEASAKIKPALRWSFVFSALISLLAFAGPLYIMNVYDRVLGSRNETTLVMLTAVVVFALLIQSALEAVRSDVLRRTAVQFDRTIAGDVFDAIQRAIVRRPLDASVPSLRDVDTLRDFFTSGALTALFDALFFPLFLVVCYILHPLFAALVLLTGGLFMGLSLLTSKATAEPMMEAEKAQRAAGRRANSTFQNFEAVQSMGMRPAMRNNWTVMHETALGWVVAADDRSVFFRTLTGFMQQASQTTVIGLTAYLVLHNQLTGGMIFAVSILVGRATAPLQHIIRSWRTIAAARQAHERLQKLLRETPAADAKMQLRAPQGQLWLDNVAVSPPGRGTDQIILRGISFEIHAGSVLAIIGPSGCGKSSLLRLLLGVWQPLTGEVRIDGTDISHWNDEALGAHLGYLPQDVELFPGTVEQNIARFTDADHESIISAAEQAGAHEMIQMLPDGYNTQVGEQGTRLSGGQRQRIGLARALFGNPAMVFLDEPNASLDAAGEERLVDAIESLRSQGRTVVFVTHKVSLVGVADYVLVLGAGTMKNFGPKAEVMQRVTQPRIVQTGTR